MNVNRFALTRHAARIVRYHADPVTRHQTVGEHTFGVLNLVVELSGGNPSTKLLKAALHHDVPEAITGDVPATALWQNDDLRTALGVVEAGVISSYKLTAMHNLKPEEVRILKLADLLELVMYCIECAETGDIPASDIARRGWHAVLTRFLGQDDDNPLLHATDGTVASEYERAVIDFVEVRYETMRRHHARR